MQFFGKTEMENSGLAGILWEFWVTKRTLWSWVVKEPDLNVWDLKLGCFRTIASLDFEIVEETQNLETATEIASLMETGKIWDF